MIPEMALNESDIDFFETCDLCQQELGLENFEDGYMGPTEDGCSPYSDYLRLCSLCFFKIRKIVSRDWRHIDAEYPPQYKKILIWTKEGNGYAGTLYNNFVADGSFAVIENVTHWKPYPEGPNDNDS